MSDLSLKGGRGKPLAREELQFPNAADYVNCISLKEPYFSKPLVML